MNISNCLLFVVFAFVNLQAQNVDFNKIIIPENVLDVSFEERLVRLAWKNSPSANRLLENTFEGQLQVKEAKWNWLNDIYAVGNVNEFTIDPSADVNNRSQFFPRYNFGIRLSLGTFAITPIKVKMAKSNLRDQEYTVNEEKLTTRAQVLIGIEKFKEQYKVLRFRRGLLEDVYIFYKESEKRFSLGEINIEEYRSSSQVYSLRAESVIVAESLFNQSKLFIESLVGLRLEEIEGYEAFMKTIEASISN